MYSASVIAAFFVNKGIESGEPLTQMKLQKMVYFAQGVSLAKIGEPLINESIEAWKFGPVVPIIYENYKLYGNSPIANVDFVYDFPFEKVKNLLHDTTATQILNYTWAATKHLTAYQFSSWTHNAGSPWAIAYKEYDRSTVISNETIKQYFIDFLGT